MPDVSEMSFTEVDNTEWNEKVQRLAERLGVPPRQQDHPDHPRFAMVLAAGDKRYDVVDLVNALLDRLDPT